MYLMSIHTYVCTYVCIFVGNTLVYTCYEMTSLSWQAPKIATNENLFRMTDLQAFMGIVCIDCISDDTY